MDQKTKLLANEIQREFPLADRPYAILAERAGVTETDAIARIADLKTQGILRQVSAIFDTRSLGYHSCLVACKVAPERADAAAAIISQHPGVSHNYARNHPYGLWFTIAVPPQSSLEAHAEALRLAAGAEAMRLMPSLRVFKIGVKLDVAETNAEALAAPRAAGESAKPVPNAVPISAPRDIAFVRVLQRDMAAVPEPYAPLARELETTTAGIFDWCRDAIRRGWIRRIAGILAHRRAGFTANAMGVWNVPDERVEEVGAFFAAQKQITHCYQRPSYPDWPYNVFTMVHGKTAEECETFLAEMARQTGIRDYGALYSTKEYKKTRLLYFTGEIENWERANVKA